MNIYNDRGQAVPLSAVASVETTWEPAARYLRNGTRLNTVTANLLTGYSFSQALDGMRRALKRILCLKAPAWKWAVMQKALVMPTGLC